MIREAELLGRGYVIALPSTCYQSGQYRLAESLTRCTGCISRCGLARLPPLVHPYNFYLAVPPSLSEWLKSRNCKSSLMGGETVAIELDSLTSNHQR